MTALTLDLVKAFLRYESDNTDQDATLALALEAGIDWVERFTGHILRPRIFNQPVRGSAGYAALDNWPVSGEPTLTYAGLDGDQEMPLQLYAVCRPATVRAGTGWPSLDANNPATITYTAGYADPEAIPAALLHGVLLYAGVFDQLRDGDAGSSSNRYRSNSSNDALKAVEAVCRQHRQLTV